MPSEWADLDQVRYKGGVWMGKLAKNRSFE